MATEPLSLMDAASRLAKADPEAFCVLGDALEECIDGTDPATYAKQLGRLDGTIRVAFRVTRRVVLGDQ